MKLVIKISRDNWGAYKASCPALPGCVVWGQSREEVQTKINQAVRGYLASLDIALPRELARMATAS